MRLKPVVFTAFVLSCVTSSLAYAQVYVGGSIGQSMTKFDNEFRNYDPAVAESSEKTKTAYKVFVGYNVNQYFAVEGGYADLGKPTYKYTESTGTGKSTQKESAWFVAAKGTLPINEQFNVFGKLGLTYNKVKGSWNDSYGQPDSNVSYSNTRSSVLYGIGAEYNVTKQIGIRLEYEDFGNFGNKFDSGDETGRTKTSMWSAGIAYKF